MRILISTVQVPFVDGGAETLARSVKKVLISKGHEAEIVSIPFKWYPPERIHEHVLACRLLDLQEANGLKVDKVIGLKFPAYHIRHPNKVNWILHQFRTAFEMWGSEHCDLSPNPNGKAVKDSIESIERSLLPEAKRIFTISETVSNRLKQYCDIDSKPLYHPPENDDNFHAGEYGDYLYFPSRLNRWKRQHLALEALALTKQPVQLHISGAPDNPAYLEKLQKLVSELGIGKRVHFLGRIPFEDMVEEFSGCKGVLFPPEQEDYGYITLEAMLSSKPVITCSDSGGPTEFIRNEKEGLVTDPTPSALAEAMDHLWKFPSFPKESGLLARHRYDELDISWDYVVENLLQ